VARRGLRRRFAEQEREAGEVVAERFERGRTTSQGYASSGDFFSSVPGKTASEGGTPACAIFQVISLDRWLGDRRDSISTLAQAHAEFGKVSGPGRPLEMGGR
jgi:hypothetical protein